MNEPTKKRLEKCKACKAPTGFNGRGKGSIFSFGRLRIPHLGMYNGAEYGPMCLGCYNDLYEKCLVSKMFARESPRGLPRGVSPKL